MKKALLAIALFAVCIVTHAQNLRTPSPSTTQTIKQDLGLNSVELSYSRPNMKGRKIFGDLVPFGKIWRTGANNATTLTFADTVTIGNVKVPAGTYGLLTMPDKDNWTIIITKQLDVTSPAAYKMSEDVVRVSAKPMTTGTPIETFTMQFGNIASGNCDLQMMWENTAVSLPISTEVDSKVMAQINSIMTKDNRPYFAAAQYYADNGKDMNQSLTWFNKAIEQNPDAFYMYYQKARVLAKLGKKSEALETAKKGIETAKIAKNDDYVALNEKLIASLK